LLLHNRHVNERLGAVTRLPDGTVTLVLGDVEGSTALWERQPDAMAPAMQALDRALETVVVRHRGVRPLEQGEGDSFVIAFTRASDAVACALDLQRELRESIVRLRIGVHTGDVELRDEANYVGPTINRAARIRDCGNGGQVLLSDTVAGLVVDGLPSGAALMDAGEHQLRGLARREHLWQLVAEDLSVPSAPLRVEKGVRSNLPTHLTSFIGRATDIETVNGLLDADRLVTLTGAGGCGKTRLALEVAGARFDRHPHGVWFIDLAVVDDGPAVAVAAVEALGLVLQAGAAATNQLTAAIGDDRVLLLFDNCEHVIGDSVVVIEQVVQCCPNAVVLATTREPLGIAGEVTFRVPSLTVPDDAERDADTEHLGSFEAVALFVDRARRLRPGFEIDPMQAGAICEICRRLDGIPLAIELAAGRMRSLTPEQIRDGLHDRFRLLSGGARTSVGRQQALQASVDWSYALLLDAERTMLNRLSAFSGGFTLEAAESVCAGGPIEAHHVLDLVTQLVDKSLVVLDDSSPFGRRYGLLETVRAYAAGRLVDAGEAETTRARHYEYFAGLATLDSEGEAAYRRRVSADYDNVRRALQWAADGTDPRSLGRLATRLGLYWSTSTRMAEGARWFGQVVEREVDDSRRASALGWYALLLGLSGDLELAPAVSDQAVALTRQLGDDGRLAWTLLFVSTGGVTLANDLLEEAMALATAVGDDQAIALALCGLGTSQIEVDLAAAIEPLEEAVAIAERGGYEYITHLAQAALARVAVSMGDVRAALPRIEASTRALLGSGESTSSALVVAVEAWLRTLVGDDGGAAASLALLDRIVRDTGVLSARVRRTYGWAMVGLLGGDYSSAIAVSSECLRAPLGPNFEARLLNILAHAEAFAGDHEAAAAHVREATARGSIVTEPGIGSPALVQALGAQARGDAAETLRLAHRYLAEALDIPHAAHVRIGAVLFLANALAAASLDERVDDVVRLLAGAHAHRERVGAQDVAYFRTLAGDAEARARDRMDADRFRALWDEGSATPWEDVVAFAQRGRGPRHRPKIGWGSLTPTERQVVDLVAEGASNSEVAERLFISVATVKSHLTHVYGKVGLTSRSQLVAEAARRALVERPRL
jgi:predicted ATPase/class 3 adenylate cyclase/DNA-binding CsgD family transcriptional regulator